MQQDKNVLSQVDPTLSVLDYISKAGFIGLLLVIIYGGMKQWWVFGWLYKQERDEKEEWKNVALRSQHIATASTNIGEKLAEDK